MDYALKLKSGVVIGGQAYAAGTVVHVDKALARNLLDRSKAELATADDVAPEPEPEPAPKPKRGAAAAEQKEPAK